MFFDVSQLQPFLQILLAALLGGIIGIEREYRKKQAGLKTFSLVAVGSCLFTLVSIEFSTLGGYPQTQVDLTRVIQAVATGVGFIGAGLIIFRQFQVEGITTAAGLWVTSAIGIAVGAGAYFLAILVALFTVLILAGFRLIEEKAFGKFSRKKHDE